MNAPATSTQQDLIVRADRQAQVVRALSAVLPAHALLWTPKTPRPTNATASPPTASGRWWWPCPKPYEQVQAVLKTCHALDVPVVARGAGTGLSGGAMPNKLGVTLSLAKFNRILKIDPVSRTAVVQGGVRNLAISEAAAPHGLYYAPDPSSQIACTIGGNVAENSGGVHCLKYGLTVHNVLKVQGLHRGGRAGRVRQRRAGRRRATTCWRSSSAARACWPSPPRSPSSWCPSRNWRAASWPASTTSARPATRWRP